MTGQESESADESLEPDDAEFAAWAAEQEQGALEGLSADELESLGLSLEEIEQVYGSIGRPPTGPDDPSGPLKTLSEDRENPVIETHDMADLERISREGKIASDKQDTSLRKVLAIWSVAAASTMLLIGTGVFLLYIRSEWGEVPVEAILGWMGASVTEILGIVWLVASYLFPKSDGKT